MMRRTKLLEISMIRSISSAASMCLLASLIVGCHHHHHKKEKPIPATQMSSMSDIPAAKVAVATIGPSKAATTQPANNNVTGTVTFTQIGDSVKVVADVLGLAPNSTHGFHIHDKGDLSAPDLSSAGGHFNPGHHIHGGPTTSAVHEGDM